MLFFSSRRRHTRFDCDWSSDVCSSDLTRRNGRDLDLWVMDPSDPRTDRMVLELEGGAYAPLDWSPDGRTILLHRSEERRVGKECRSRWSPHHSKKKEIFEYL